MRFGRHVMVAGLVALVAWLVSPAVASATHGGDTLVVGRQPAIAVLAEQAERAGGRGRPAPSRLVLAPAPTTTSTWRPATPATHTTCPFTHGVGISGISFSFDSRRHAGPSPPTPAGPAAALPGVGPTRRALHAEQVGPIGTLPWYFENGLVSDGDPALAFGPRPGRQRRLLLGERLAAVLRQPDRPTSAPSAASRLQGRGGHRRLADRRPPRPRGWAASRPGWRR